MDGKGGLILMNDDVMPVKGDLSSKIEFTPESGSGTQKYYISVSGYTGNPGAMNTGDYTVKVKEDAVLPVGAGGPIMGTGKADKLVGTDNAESIMGEGGNDTLDGRGGDDELHGGGGADLLIGGKGADVLRGGSSKDSGGVEHKDTISYEGSVAGVTINLRDGTAMGGDAAGDDIGTDIENVMGSMYDDVITGTDSVNVGNSLWGLGGMDRLYGGEGEDKLYGGAGDDMLDGGDENDTLEGGYGADVLTGGHGADTASYSMSMMGVTVRLHSGQAMGGDAEGDTWGDMVTVEYTMPAEDPEDPDVVMEETVPNIVNLTGSGMADILAGDSRDNVIMGMGGDDRIYGGPGGGDDTLHGDAGNDHLYGGRGNDTLRGGAGNDHLWGNGGTDTLEGGTGNDTYYLHAAPNGAVADTVTEDTTMMGGMADTITFAKSAFGAAAYNIPVSVENIIGSMEDDTITGNASMNTIEGGDGADTLSGGATDGDPGDTVSYASSDRRVRVDLSDDSASGGHASGDTLVADTFENVMGSAHGDILTGDGGDNTLWGLDGDDTIEGGAGNDTIEGGAGADEMHGGYSSNGDAADIMNTEMNTLSYAGSDAGVTVNLATASASGGHADGDEIETYEFQDADGDGSAGGDDDGEKIDVATFVNVTGSAHNDHLTGDMFANNLTGGKGDDSLRGGAGADVLAGGPGADRLDGGSSTHDHDNDGTTPEIQHEDWAVYRSATAGVMVNLNTGNGTGGDAMGDTLKNIELVWGSKHGDTFVASEGVDIIHGDGGSDTVSYEASKHGVTVTLNDGQWTAATGDDLPAMFDPATDEIVAQWRGGTDTRPAAVPDDGSDATKSYAEGDILASIENVTGSRQDDTITGDAVPNVIKGGDGNDKLNGGDQNDKLYGGAGNDILGAADFNDDGNATAEAGDDMLNGGAGNDKLYGGAGSDTLVGGAGDDELDGGSETDTTADTTSTDTFVFAPGNGSDVITNFDVTTVTTPDDDATSTATTGDKIDLSAFGLTADDLNADGVISVRAGNTVINLEDYGGGRITIQDVTDLNVSVLDDTNGNGMIETGETDGIFIL